MFSSATLAGRTLIQTIVNATAALRDNARCTRGRGHISAAYSRHNTIKIVVRARMIHTMNQFGASTVVVAKVNKDNGNSAIHNTLSTAS